MTAATHGIGRTLARLAALSPRRVTVGAGHESRAQILDLICSAPEPVDIEWLGEKTQLHANTVRGHLDVLMAAGHVVREPDPSGGRGRPRMLYRPGTTAAGVYAELVQVLMDELGDTTDAALVDDAAATWAEVVDDGPAVETIDAAVERAVHALSVLGFTVEVSPVGDTITLGTCPYADLVAEQPVICEIHTAMLGELLHRTGQPVSVAEMQVWAAPGLCRARLNRPDQQPAFVITPPEKPAGRTRKKSS